MHTCIIILFLLIKLFYLLIHLLNHLLQFIQFYLMLINFINLAVMFSLTACCMQNHLSTQLSYSVLNEQMINLKMSDYNHNNLIK